MEEGQIDHIMGNLDDLYYLTKVNTGLLAVLQTHRNLLHRGEVSQLENLNLSDYDRARDLYAILMKKCSAFGILKAALKKTKQSGAFRLLDAYCYQEYAFPYRNVIVISDPGINLPREEISCQFIPGKFENRDVSVRKRSLENVDTKRVWGEVELLPKLDWHKNIVRYFKTEMGNGYILIALERCKINLENWLTKSREPIEIDVDPVQIMRQVLDGMEYLHNERIIHGNLNPENILLTNPDKNVFWVKISDFALSSKVQPDEKSCVIISTEFVPSGYSAPEVIQLHRIDETRVLTGFAADIFSLGCIFHFVLTNGRHHPFGIDDGNRSVTILNGNRADILELLDQLLQSNQDIRFADVILRMTSNGEDERPLASAVYSERELWKL